MKIIFELGIGLQEKMNGLENELDLQTAENLKLKGLNFDLGYKIHYYSLIVEQTNKKLKLLNDKYAKLVKDLEISTSLQDKELKRLNLDLEASRKDLERCRRDFLLKSDELKRVEGDNTRWMAEQNDVKVEEFESRLRESEAVRKELQMRLEHAQSQWEVKLKLWASESDKTGKE